MKKFAIALALIATIALVTYLTACPCGPVPGAWLFGEQQDAPITDWSFVNDRDSVPLCQLQVTTWHPQSINLNCMADAGELRISCSNCAGKRWSAAALTHPDAWLRAGGDLYPVALQRITQADALDAAWSARLAKIEREPAPRPDHWWAFALSSRAAD